MAVLSRGQKVSIFAAILVLSGLGIYFSGNSQIAGLRSSAILGTNNNMVTAVDDIMRSYNESKETLDEEGARAIYQQLEAMKSTLQLSSNSYAGALNSNNRNIAQMQQVITKMENEKSSNSQEISRLTTEINKRTSEITRMEAKRKADLKSCLAKAKREKKGKDKCTASSNRTTAVIRGLRGQIAPLQTSITTINARATSSNIEIEEKKQRITQITEGNTQFQERINDIQTTQEAINNAQNTVLTDYPGSNQESDGGSEAIEGCTDGLASNWNSSATVDDGSCEYGGRGCMDPGANNYDSQALINDPSLCKYDKTCFISDHEMYISHGGYSELELEADDLSSKYTLLYDKNGKFVMIHPEVSENDLNRMSEVLTELKTELLYMSCKPENREHIEIVSKKISEILNQGGQ